MIRWSHLDTTPLPGGGGELRLMRRGDEFSIMAGATELMNSRLGGSEAVLAELACAPLRDRAGARVLVGGLGMGFTLRAALAALGADAEITVAELAAGVIAWARGPMGAVFGDSLADPRVRIGVEDVAAPIARATAAYDAILLDVDNGPQGLTRRANDALYDAAGLAAAHRALAPGGRLAVWSCAPDAAFARRLSGAGFAVAESKARAAPNGRGSRHTLWLATKR